MGGSTIPMQVRCISRSEQLVAFEVNWMGGEAGVRVRKRIARDVRGKHENLI